MPNHSYSSACNGAEITPVILINHQGSDLISEKLPVSVIILNYNGADLLLACLDSLRQATANCHEVVVVDNGSTDNSMRVLADYSWVKSVRTERNLGSSGGYNLGLQHSTGEFLLIMNNDIVANPDFILVLYEYLQAHPEVGIAQAKMTLPRHNGSLEVCGSFFTTCGFPYHYGCFKADGPKYTHSQPIFSCKGACMMLRREVVRRAGGYLFNREFHCYYEETDLCHRAWLAGYETHFVASPPVKHLAGATISREEGRGFSLYYYLRNMIFSLATILEWPWLLRIFPLYFLVFVMSMVIAAFAGRWGATLAHWNALVDNIRRLHEIRAQRVRIQSLRKRSDREIFNKILRNPRFDYFLKTFTGSLARYVD